jgi:hypothetical protein
VWYRGFASLDREEKAATVGEQNGSLFMGLPVNIMLLFVICGGIPAEFARGKFLVNQTTAVAANDLAGENPEPVSDWPIWRSSQKGVAKRRPDARYLAPLAPWVYIYVVDPEERYLTVSLSSFSIRAVRQHQSLQVYRL